MVPDAQSLLRRLPGKFGDNVEVNIDGLGSQRSVVVRA